MKVLFDTSTKVTAFIEGDSATVVHPTEATVAVTANGTTNAETGAPVTVPGYVSELGPFLGINSATAGQANPTQTDDTTPAVTFDLSPGDELPLPPLNKINVANLQHPLGVGAYVINVPANFTGKGWIKGRATTGDNFAVRYSLVQAVQMPEGSPVGSMELPLNFDGTEKDGMSNLKPGGRYVLNLDNVAGQPITLQITHTA